MKHNTFSAAVEHFQQLQQQQPRHHDRSVWIAQQQEGSRLVSDRRHPEQAPGTQRLGSSQMNS